MLFRVKYLDKNVQIRDVESNILMAKMFSQSLTGLSSDLLKERIF